MSRLEDLSQEFRKQQISKNSYKTEDQYVTGHENAISDGDPKGKGENNGSIGSSEDIQKRKELLTKNKYGSNNPYNDSNA